MIFVTVGSQKFQFDRLLMEIDNLIEKNKITEEVFAQIGYSDYKPKNYKYKDFIGREEFLEIMEKCDKVITHGGTGAIIGAVKQEKKVIAVPRLKEFKEHVDDHQIQIIEQFSEMNFIVGVKTCNEIEMALDNISRIKLNKYKSNTINIINNITSFIEL